MLVCFTYDRRPYTVATDFMTQLNILAGSSSEKSSSNLHGNNNFGRDIELFKIRQKSLGEAPVCVPYQAINLGFA